MPHPASSHHAPARTRNPWRVLSRNGPGPRIVVVPGSPRKPFSAAFAFVVPRIGVANPGINHSRYSPLTKNRRNAPASWPAPEL